MLSINPQGWWRGKWIRLWCPCADPRAYALLSVCVDMLAGVRVDDTCMLLDIAASHDARMFETTAAAAYGAAPKRTVFEERAVRAAQQAQAWSVAAASGC